MYDFKISNFPSNSKDILHVPHSSKSENRKYDILYRFLAVIK